MRIECMLVWFAIAGSTSACVFDVDALRRPSDIPDAGADGSVDAGADGSVDAGADGGTGFADTTHRYVISAFVMPEQSGAVAVGFNLDDVSSNGAGTTCTDLAADFSSVNDPGEQGIDNQYGSLMPTLGPALSDHCPGSTDAECFSDFVRTTIHEGWYLLIVEVSRINDYRNDSSVGVSLYAASVGCGAPPCAPALDGTSLAPEQTFDTAIISDVEAHGEIRDGRLRVQLQSFPIVIQDETFSATFLLKNVELRSDIETDTRLTNGAIGGSFDIAEQLEIMERLQPGGSSVWETVLMERADLEPEPGNSTLCRSISAGVTFEAVGAAGDLPAGVAP